MAYYRDDAIDTLADALQNATVDRLKQLATLLSKEKKPTRKADFIDFIQRQIEGPKLRAIWDQLDATQQAAVAEVVHSSDSIFHSDRFGAKYQTQPNWGETDGWSRYLTKPSLLVVFFYNSVMPGDLKARLADFVPKPEPIQLQTAAELPETVALDQYTWNQAIRKREHSTVQIPLEHREMEVTAIHDLPALLHLIDAGKIAVSDKTKLPSAAACKAITALLFAGDFYDDQSEIQSSYHEKIGPIRAFAWPLLLQVGGLAELSGKKLRLSNAGRKALTAPIERTIRTLWLRWLKTTLVDELSRISCIKGQGGKGKRGLTAVAGRRSAINAALFECAVGEWVSVDDLFRKMQATGEDFQITRDPWRLYIADPQYGSLGYDGYHDWNILQGRYALCLLFEYAATLGLIDVAYIAPSGARPDYGDLWGTDDLEFFSRYDGLQYFRLTPLGAYCLNISGDYTPVVPQQRTVLKVLANLDVVASGEPLSPTDAFLLDSYIERKADAVWHLDQAKLLAAVADGKTVAALRELLETRSADPLPETVTRFLKDIEDRANRLQDKGTARLIECADAALATLIANDSRTKPFCMLAGERHLVVYTDTETRFRSALRKLGYSLPK